MPSELVCPHAFLSPLEIDEAVTRALAEDLGRAGDVTSIATVPESTKAHAVVVARKPGTIAGLPVAAASFRRLAPEIEITSHVRDGAQVGAKTKLMSVAGPARAVLAAERTALNFAGHLSGVATATAAFVQKVAYTKTRITCTRKTLPGLRALQKYAVRCRAVLERAKDAIGHLVKVEIEVDSLGQLREVLDVGVADAVLLDNFAVADMRRAVELVAGRLQIEASGGITLDTIAAIAETGVDYASSGWITHSAPNLDIALDIEM